jgi:hypothetical protein
MSDAICVSCGEIATVVDPRNDAMRCEKYPACAGRTATHPLLATVDQTLKALAEEKEISSRLREEIQALQQEIKSMSLALDIYLSVDDKCDQLLRSVGLDDTINVVPRLAELVEQYRKLKDAREA